MRRHRLEAVLKLFSSVSRRLGELWIYPTWLVSGITWSAAKTEYCQCAIRTVIRLFLAGVRPNSTAVVLLFYLVYVCGVFLWTVLSAGDTIQFSAAWSLRLSDCCFIEFSGLLSLPRCDVLDIMHRLFKFFYFQRSSNFCSLAITMVGCLSIVHLVFFVFCCADVTFLYQLYIFVSPLSQSLYEPQCCDVTLSFLRHIFFYPQSRSLQTASVFIAKLSFSELSVSTIPNC